MCFIKFFINWVIVLTSPIWILPLLIFATVGDAVFNKDVNTRKWLSGNKFIWE